MTTTATEHRASVHTDMPADLSEDDRKAYVRGYARSCTTFVQRHGGPRAVSRRLSAEDAVLWAEPGDDGQMTLHERTVAHEWERHPAAHRAGMRAIGEARRAQAERERTSARILVPMPHPWGAKVSPRGGRYSHLLESAVQQ